MSENSSEPTSENSGTDAEEKGAEEAGQPEELDAGGYGGPGTEDEIAPGFEAKNNGGS
jgi:hypothetical protein